jgi:hypothetical protein
MRSKMTLTLSAQSMFNGVSFNWEKLLKKIEPSFLRIYVSLVKAVRILYGPKEKKAKERAM